MKDKVKRGESQNPSLIREFSYTNELDNLLAIDKVSNNSKPRKGMSLLGGVEEESSFELSSLTDESPS